MSWAGDFAFVRYGAEQGLPQSQVKAIAQDRDGALWLGTIGGGLVRFDGVTFESWRSERGLPYALINDVVVDRDGRVFVATSGGVFERRGDQIVRVSEEAESLDLALGPDGVLALVGGRVHTLVDGRFAVSQAMSQVADVRRLSVDVDGQTWVIGRWGVGCFENDVFIVVESSESSGRSWLNGAPHPEGGLWASTSDGLYRARPGRVERAAVDRRLGPSWHLHVDPAGTLWGAADGGFFSVRAGHVTWFDAENGFEGTDVWTTFTDREGNLFVGTDGRGLWQLALTGFRHEDFGVDLPLAPRVLVEGPSGDRWLGTIGDGLWHADPGGPLVQTTAALDTVRDLRLEPDGTLAVASNRGLGRWDGERLVLEYATAYPAALLDVGGARYAATLEGLMRQDDAGWTLVPGSPKGLASARLLDDDTAWLGGLNELFHYDFREGRVLEALHADPSRPFGDVNGIAVAPDGTLWAATDSGLLERPPGAASFRLLGLADGLPDETINLVTLDARTGDPWIGTNRGVAVRIDGHWRVFDERRGLPEAETNVGAAMWRGSSLWIGTIDGYVIADAVPPPPNPHPPIVRLRGRVGDVDLPDGAKAPRGADVQLVISAVGLTSPSRIRVRTRLLGVSDVWADTPQRTLHFPALPGGDYALEVVACNEDDVCSDVERYVFRVVPAWWETTWARAVGLLGVAGAAWGVQALRARQLRARQRELEHLVGVRTRELSDEKARSDGLLRNILPDSIAEELKANGRARSRRFDDVTVLFTDFKGFTAIAGETPPERIVRELNEVFAAFDDIARRHRLEKLKTIGDAYMAAAGLPEPNDTHPVDAVEAACEMVRWLARRHLDRADALPFHIRIGLHTGPVVAGVVGNWKFAYDIWGDTVNTAARMESSGEPGRVNLSAATYERVRERIPCVPRGKITAKGKGEMDMYFVDCESRASTESLATATVLTAVGEA